MKKKVLIVAALISSMLTYAQDSGGEGEELKTKKGRPILPKGGDIALGWDFGPFFDLAFNSLRYVSIMGNSAAAQNGQTNNTLQYTNNNANQIVGKYFLDNTSAIRARIGINTISGKWTNQVQDAVVLDAAQTSGIQSELDAAFLYRVDDVCKFNKRNVRLVAGYEKRRGYGRIQGFYGGEIGFSRTSSYEDYTYGNAFTDKHNIFFTNNFPGQGVTTVNPNAAGRWTRVLDRTYRPTFSWGVRGFIGVEYFFLPKISVAAEYGWGFSASRRKGEKVTQEVYFNGQNGPEVIIEKVDVDNGVKSRGFSVDNNNTNFGTTLSNTPNGATGLGGGSGSLTLLIHF